MQRHSKYKITIWILAVLVILESILLISLWIKRPKKIPRAPIAIKGKVAIVIDDWGYNLNNLDSLKQIKYPLTISVLPHLNYSKAVAKDLHRMGYQIILHLPMEPYEKFRLEKNTIMISMEEPAIIDIVRKDLESVSYAAGVSNHMGSKATEDMRTMGIIFKELRKRRLYFLDSLSSGESVCWDVANRMHLGFIKRDVFLDNEENAEYIRGQLNKLKMRAAFYGQAVGIGHDRKVTLGVLKEEMPKLEKEGYKFVFVSQLLR